MSSHRVGDGGCGGGRDDGGGGSGGGRDGGGSGGGFTGLHDVKITK